MSAPLYTLHVFAGGIDGAFVSKAFDAEQRIKTIREQGYLRKAATGNVEWFPPHRIRHVIIEGPALDAAIEDEYLPPITYTVTWIDKWPDRLLRL